jgi:drug/metabolite transporter (DMT)-like permease
MTPTQPLAANAFNPRLMVLLILLTVVWGINWPVMKYGLSGQFPPLLFRTICLVLGLPVLGLALLVLKVPFRIPRAHWPELFRLSCFNMFFWHACIILAVQDLSSGRAAILGYTMPTFSALLGAAFFGARLSGRAWAGVGAAALGTALLLWHEFAGLAGKPQGVVLALVAAATWGLGTQMLRHTRMPVPTLSISFWMTVLTAFVMLGLSTLLEREQWRWPASANWAGIGYNAVLVFGFAHAAWFTLARNLPPVASTLSVMFIPVLGVLVGAAWLSETLHWQDWAAMLLILVAIGSVLTTGTASKRAE